MNKFMIIPEDKSVLDREVWEEMSRRRPTGLVGETIFDGGQFIIDMFLFNTSSVVLENFLREDNTPEQNADALVNFAIQRISMPKLVSNDMNEYTVTYVAAEHIGRAFWTCILSRALEERDALRNNS